MSTVNLNIRTDKEIKEKAENIFQELGLNMTTAINIFLRTSIRENGIPFDLKIDSVNDETKLAIEEGRKIADDKTIEGYVSIEELKKALENLR
ncbi:MAG: type II toxin-antitoxin system RelB/DinJ family antitoxin [Finegoldia magna]|uniref:type II toxin-antitoxin system RelB/DinJ family antitoxin n=1 Tax=Finegoldia magna TaxID=1260 RepID=UPI0028FE5AEF|nr:type II toxin-antitoxin system RelB/DinJ family antitoxin [Finegoldia magna]MDU2638961.1 type II toxin-antitoxin system RelB/DinJ family antitoxin [Finegoldia magna]